MVNLTRAYLRRIAAFNPTLGAVIETNPDASAIAAQLDYERRLGFVRGPLHGIPVLVKDNVATADEMQTTAGARRLRLGPAYRVTPSPSLRASLDQLLGDAALAA